jgi:O-antigen/teichoic acid export membrane protein
MDQPTTAIEAIDVERDRGSIHRHELDPISLVSGLVFAIGGLAFLIGDIDATDLNGAWGWAAFLGATGFLLLALGYRRQRRQ